MKIWDISPAITPELAVFPGDIPFRREVSMDFSKGHSLQLSSFRCTFHLGAHADSSSHYHPQGHGVEKRSIPDFLGRAQVIHVPTRWGERIRVSDVSKPIQAPRVLFRTLSFPDPNRWRDDFMSLSPELLDFLAVAGVRLVGIDTPSVDPSTSKDLPSHASIFRHQMSVLEGLMLDAVPEGIYRLIALPLPFVGADASPVRAILTEISDPLQD